MKKLILLILVSTNLLFSYSSHVKQARAIGIFDENGNGENIQRSRKTKNDYNGTCFVKVFVEGKLLNQKPQVKIGNSLGHFQKSKPIYDNRKIQIGKVYLYKHYNVKSGYIDVKIGNRYFDRKVFVK